MKKVITILVLVLISLNIFGQGNDTSKYIKYDYQYGIRQLRLWSKYVQQIPDDTTYSKDGIARKGSRFFVGDGVKWTEVTGGPSVINIVDSTHISICNFNSCDTILTTVNPQNVAILNDSTLLVCANTDPPECDTLHIPRTQFASTLFDTIPIYAQFDSIRILISSDSFNNQFLPNFGVVTDTNYVYYNGDSLRITCHTYTDETLVCDTQRVITPGNISRYVDTSRTEVHFINHQTINGDTIIRVTHDLSVNADSLVRDSVHLDFHPETHAGQVIGTVDGINLEWVDNGSGGGDTTTLVQRRDSVPGGYYPWSNPLGFITSAQIPDHHVNGLVYGGVVTWLHDYVYNVSASGYWLNDIFYESLSTDITLTAADATLDRIDLFLLTTSSTAIVLDGTPGSSIPPDYDNNIQLQISFALVTANTTEPPGVVNNWIYKEGVEWTPTASHGTINPVSTNNPYAGSKDVEGTTVLNAQYVQFVSPGAVDFTKYNYLTFQIRSKGNFSTTKKLVLRWLAGSSNATGNNVPIGSGSYGFISTVTASYQTITIPIADFGNISAAADRLRITQSNTSGNAGWYIDNIQLQYIPTTTPNVGVAFYGKNTTGDSTVLLLTNGTRYAALDRGITALTGDVTASGSGSVAATLATVNSNVGSFTNANITVNAKGLVTAASNGSSSGNFANNEEKSGSTSSTITLDHTYTSGTIKMWKNGVRMQAADFTEATGTTITLNVPRLSYDFFTFDYQY